MGTRNRQRRAEKQRRRERAVGGRRPAGKAHEDSGGWDVRTLILSAAHASCSGHGMDVAGVVAGLDRDPGRWWTVADVLDGLLAEAVRGAWLKGWQPADVARLVERRLGARHDGFLVDVIAADARRYQAGPVDARWTAQLGGLGATVWWAPDKAHLQQWAVREGMAWVDALACGIEVLSALLHLAPLPRLCDPPGEPRRGPAPRRAARPGGDTRMLDRVRALLAKAESTTFPEEAEALAVKAQELMARHSIDEAMVDAAAGQSGDPTTGVRLAVDDPYASPKSMLLSEVARANECRSVWSKELGFSTVFGFEADVDFVEMLYTSLLVQATSAMVAAGAQITRDGRSRTRSFRSSFLVAYANRIGQRLQAARDASRESAADAYGAALLPVLADRSAAVEDAVTAAFPRLVSHSVGISNAAGWAAGSAAAELASLSTRPEMARPA